MSSRMMVVRVVMIDDDGVKVLGKVLMVVKCILRIDFSSVTESAAHVA